MRKVSDLRTNHVEQAAQAKQADEAAQVKLAEEAAQAKTERLLASQSACESTMSEPDLDDDCGMDFEGMDE